MYPYKISFLEQLLPEGNSRWVAYAQKARLDFKNDFRHLDRIVFSDGCVLRTNGAVSEHNARV